MEIRKGPYGHYVIRKIEDIGSINDYTQKIVAENIPGHMLPLYIIPTIDHYEASYDFSGLSPLAHMIPMDITGINKLRKAAGDLFSFLADLPDFLLSPASAVLDGRYIFTDEDYSDLNICFDPVKVRPDTLNIRSLSSTGIRDLLNSECMSKAISPEEVDGIIYAIEQNDSDLLRKEAAKIMIPIEEEKPQSMLLGLNEFKALILASILSLIFAVTGLTLLSFIAVSAEVFFAVKIRKGLMNSPKIHIPVSGEQTKKLMLFGNETGGGRCLDALILTSRDAVTGSEEKKAIYTDNATIGSDRFLCDVYTPDDAISPIHAQIRKIGRTYYVSDLSKDNSTFLNDMRLESGREYEIKSEQILMCGNKEFRIDII